MYIYRCLYICINIYIYIYHPLVPRAWGAKKTTDEVHVYIHVFIIAYFIVVIILSNH